MVSGLPSNYAFVLMLCKEKYFIHPCCQQQVEEQLWFTGGLPLSYIPLPIPDPKRPWGGQCSDCQSEFGGHYLPPREHSAWVASHGNGEMVKSPPSEVLKKAYDKKRKQEQAFSEEEILILSRQVLSPVRDVKMYLEHFESVTERRKEGARKAARTRNKTKGM